MWTMVKTELDYHKNSILLFLAIIALAFYFFEILSSDDWDYIIVLMVFFMIHSVISTRMREQRNRQQLHLPVSAQQIALVRLFTVYLLCGFAFLELLILYFIFQKNAAFPIAKINILFGIIVFLYSMFFIFYDLYPSVFKKYGKFIVALLAMGISASMAIGILVMTKPGSGAPLPDFIKTFFNLIRNYNPFTGASGGFRFLIFNLIVSGFTIITFRRCKSYVE